MNKGSLFLLALFFSYSSPSRDPPVELYEVSDDLGVGRRFDGIGGLSGGGVSCAVTRIWDGTESSHMHEEWDENYNRGYEWWMMKEAKKRNPDIKLWGLSWAWPGWIGEGVQSPYKNLSKTAAYTIKWIQGAKKYHNLTIDYIGIWNEQLCNYDYILELRKTLDLNKLQNVKVVACDGFVGDLFSIMNNRTVAEAVYAFGVHYPGTVIPKQAIATNYTIWSSEDYSTLDDDVGAGCWARILNQDYVVGYMTSTTAWNLIASYYKGLPYEYDGLMNAIEPWSGYYQVKDPIWITAHTTQFTKIGFRYLLHDHGVGLLKHGGSYVSLTSKDRKNLTIIIETMTHDHSICIRPSLPPYQVQPQKAIFKFGGAFASLTQMHVWRSSINFTDPSKSVIFKYEGKVEVVEGRLSMNLAVDSVYTLASTQTGQKGDHGPVPGSKPFPVPYFDDFQKYQINEEPFLLTPQVGVWEIYGESNGNQFARQVVQNKPISWCSQDNQQPLALIGDVKWKDVIASAKVRIPSVNGTKQIFLAVRVSEGGCDTVAATGLFFWLTVQSRGYAVTTDIGGLTVTDAGLLANNAQLVYDKWYNVTAQIRGDEFSAFLDDTLVTQFSLDQKEKNASGFVAIGSGGWGFADFDDLNIAM